MVHKRPEAFICDIDGTIADHGDEESGLIRGHYEYDKVKFDRPKPEVIRVVRILSKELQPIFVSGRMDESANPVRIDTVHWIKSNVWPYDINPQWPLFMRADGDYRADYVIKEEIFTKLIEPRWNVRFAIDDRLQVCRMWHRIGVPVFRVGDPDAVF